MVAYGYMSRKQNRPGGMQQQQAVFSQQRRAGGAAAAGHICWGPGTPSSVVGYSPLVLVVHWPTRGPNEMVLEARSGSQAV